MDVYDFDGTIYRGDSTAHFVRFCALRHPRVVATLPRTGAAALLCLKLHKMEKTQYKRILYRFLKLVPDIEKEVYQFWASHERNIGGPCGPQPGDLVISAGPEFLLKGVCARRGLELIASQVDPHTGRVLGPNNSSEEKVVRFRALYPEAKIERFYSDSRNDDFLADIAEQAFFVDLHKNTMVPWPK